MATTALQRCLRIRDLLVDRILFEDRNALPDLVKRALRFPMTPDLLAQSGLGLLLNDSSFRALLTPAARAMASTAIRK